MGSLKGVSGVRVIPASNCALMSLRLGVGFIISYIISVEGTVGKLKNEDQNQFKDQQKNGNPHPTELLN